MASYTAFVIATILLCAATVPVASSEVSSRFAPGRRMSVVVPRSIAQAPSLAPSTFRSQSQSPFVRQQVITPFTAEEPPRNSRSASLPGGGFSNAGSLGSSKGGDVSAANTSTDTDTNPGQASSVSGSKPFSYVFSSLPKFFGGTRR